MKPAALLALWLAACIGPPDRAVLSGGHAWGGADGALGGVKGVEQDLGANWVGVGLEFPIAYQERHPAYCRRCEALAPEVERLRAELREATRRPEPAPAEGGGVEGLWIGSGAVATLAGALAWLMRLGVVPTIQPRSKDENETTE